MGPLRCTSRKRCQATVSLCVLQGTTLSSVCENERKIVPRFVKRAVGMQLFLEPGFGPSIPQQLKDGHLFGGEVSPQEVHRVHGEMRGDHRTQKFRAPTALQHLWTQLEVYFKPYAKKDFIHIFIRFIRLKQGVFILHFRQDFRFDILPWYSLKKFSISSEKMLCCFQKAWV